MSSTRRSTSISRCRVSTYRARESARAPHANAEQPLGRQCAEGVLVGPFVTDVNRAATWDRTARPPQRYTFVRSAARNKVDSAAAVDGPRSVQVADRVRNHASDARMITGSPVVDRQ